MRIFIQSFKDAQRNRDASQTNVFFGNLRADFTPL